MPSFYIPNQGFIRQLNLGDKAGELWSTWNIDLHTSPGKIKLARPLKVSATSATIDHTDIVGLNVLTGRGYALTDAVLYDSTQPYTSWASETTTPSDASDMTVFRGQLVLDTNNNLDAYDGSSYTSDWWTARGNPALTNNNPTVQVPRVLEVSRIGAETLVVTDGPNVHAYTGPIGSGTIGVGGVVGVTVDLDTAFSASCFKSSIRRGWIGTFTEDAAEAYVFEWDVASTNYTQAYPTGAKAVLAMELIEDSPLIITERGEFRKFNGAGFTTVAQFPFATSPKFADGVETGLIQNNHLSRPVHPKGMKRVGNIVLINVAFADVANDKKALDERSHNGIWALDLKTYSLTHLASPDNEQVFAASSPLMVINDRNGRIFTGGRKVTTATTDSGIWMEDLSDSTQHYGYFVTTEIESETGTEVFPGIWIKAALGANDSIRVKYRTTKDVLMPVNGLDGVWESSTKFNCTDTNLAQAKTRYDAGHRDELEVTVGSGAGRLAHITNLEKSSLTYSITVDEAVGTAGQAANIRIDNWKEIDRVYTDDDGEWLKFGTDGVNAPWIQFKVELRGRAGNPTIREIYVPTITKQSS